jgi:hypothetical protein
MSLRIRVTRAFAPLMPAKSTARSRFAASRTPADA